MIVGLQINDAVGGVFWLVPCRRGVSTPWSRGILPLLEVYGKFPDFTGFTSILKIPSIFGDTLGLSQANRWKLSAGTLAH